jgi:DNA mismatch repair protein MutL
MPDIIKLLSDSVANQIAAGEVIQRPASVVIELMENSIDAGASSLSVIIRDAGKALVQVIDNGCGMSVTDARMAFERHSTSKISKAEDLFAIHTLGFRGEALASVAAVSEVVLKTRRTEDEVGTMLEVSGSVVKNQEPVSCPAGSNFMIKNLFYNVPARRKFLKSNTIELKHSINEFIHVALTRPNVHFTLTHNETEIYNLPPGNIKQKIIGIFGKSINQNLIPIKTETSIIAINGFIGTPESSRKTFGEQFFYVNGRYMRHPYFHKAVLEAYETVLPPGAIPTYFIYFNTRPESIDINIHPTKTEIKFEEERSVFQILMSTIREALGRHNMVPSLDFETTGVIDIPVFRKDEEVRPPEIQINPEFNPFSGDSSGSGRQESYYHRETVKNWEKLYEGLRQNDTRLSQDSQTKIGTDQKEFSTKLLQYKNKYIIVPVKSGLMVIDQKRAHEKILYDKYLDSLMTRKGLAQQELFPATIELDASDHTLLMDLLNDFIQLGFDIRDLGNNNIVINGFPSDIEHIEPKSMIDCFLEEYKQCQSDIKVKARERLALSVARASSISYQKVLSETEMRDLVDHLFNCSNPGQLPDGRIVFTIFASDEIEKRFSR